MSARARMLSVLAILIGGALGLICATQTWIHVTLADGATQPLDIPGTEAITMLAPLSLAAMASGLTLAIAGRTLRYIIGTIALAVGITLLITTVLLVARPQPSYAFAAVTKLTGISGATVITDMIATISLSPLPYVALIAWLIIILGGGYALVSAHTWRESGKKYTTSTTKQRSEGPLDKVDSWDELSRGDDPTQSA